MNKARPFVDNQWRII